MYVQTKIIVPFTIGFQYCDGPVFFSITYIYVHLNNTIFLLDFFRSIFIIQLRMNIYFLFRFSCVNMNNMSLDILSIAKCVLSNGNYIFRMDLVLDLFFI